MRVSIIAAVDLGGAYGVGGGLPWKVMHDLPLFRAMTLGCAVISGRLTWESLPPSKLPGRYSVVVSSCPRMPGDKQPDHIAPNLSEALDHARSEEVPEIFVIGGALLWLEALMLDVVDRAYMTHVMASAADARAGKGTGVCVKTHIERVLASKGYSAIVGWPIRGTLGETHPALSHAGSKGEVAAVRMTWSKNVDNARDDGQKVRTPC